MKRLASVTFAVAIAISAIAVLKSIISGTANWGPGLNAESTEVQAAGLEAIEERITALQDQKSSEAVSASRELREARAAKTPGDRQRHYDEALQAVTKAEFLEAAPPPQVTTGK